MRPTYEPRPDSACSCEDQSLCRRVSAEFREMPGLKVTAAQAARLFSLDPRRCEHILGSLVKGGLLATDGHAYARADMGRRSV